MTTKHSDAQLKNIIEGSIFMAGGPISITMLFENVLDNVDTTRNEVKKIIAKLQQDYTGRGINIVETSSGFALQTAPEINEPLSFFWTKNTPRYSKALLETLSIIAYKQPVTRADIERVRGVSVNYNIIQTLKEREWIKKVGYKELPGRPSLYGTTKQFLDYFQIKNLKELPDLQDASIEENHEFNEQLNITIESSAQISNKDKVTTDNIIPEGKK
jgi:segregation and condensation protein B